MTFSRRRQVSSPVEKCLRFHNGNKINAKEYEIRLEQLPLTHLGWRGIRATGVRVFRIPVDQDALLLALKAGHKEVHTTWQDVKKQ